MSERLPFTTLGDHVDILTGFPFKSDNYSPAPEDIRLLRGDNVVQGAMRWENAKRWPRKQTQDVAQYAVREGDVVLAMDRPWIEAGLKYARVLAKDLPALLVQRVACLRSSADLDQRFLYYLIGSPAFAAHVLGIQTGTAIPHISARQIAAFSFRLPPLLEQRAIAGVLGVLDDKIELNRRLSWTLERVARAMFRAWFVDSEPVKAKSAGARYFPSMAQEVFTTLPIRLVESDLGPIPEGWGVATVSDIASLSRTVDPQEHLEETFEHLSIPAFDNSKRPVVEFGRAIKSSKLIVTEDSVLISKLNPRTPRVWLPPTSGAHRQITSTEFLVTIPKPGWHRCYLYCLVQQKEFIEDMAQRASGTSNSHQRVKPSDYLGTRIVIPPQSVRQAFEDTSWPLLDLSRSAALENAKLAAMRDYLLPKLLSGELQVEGRSNA